MSLKPIELQVLLNQISEVGKREKDKIEKRRNDEKEMDKALQKERITQEEAIVNVDRPEVGGDENKQIPKVRRDLEEKQEQGKGGKEKNARLKEEYKGNFLDIIE